MEDYKRTEYLSSSLQAVESTRHWAFHNERLSPEEIASSLAYSVSIVDLLSISEPQQESKQVVREQLRDLHEIFCQFLDGKSSAVEGLQMSTLEGAEVLLHRCMVSLEESLGEFLRLALTHELSKRVSEAFADESHVNLLLRFLKDNHNTTALRTRKVRTVSLDMGSV